MGRRKKNGGRKTQRSGGSKRVDASGSGFGGSLGDLLRAQGLAPTGAVESPEPAAPEPPTSGPSADDLSALGKVVVRRTRKGRGGRTVTLIEGLDDLPADQRDALASAARKALGTGARVEEASVAVQGDVGPRLADWLRARGARRVIVS